jgi:hypothetical protein
MAFSLSRNERIYLQKQTDPRVIPNTGGTATVAVANYLQFKQASLNPQVALLQRPDKTGTRSATRGVLGRKAGSWSIDLSLATSGTAGTVPPCDPILTALFGQNGQAMTGSGAVTNATNATPIVVSQSAHGYANGDVVAISSVGGNVAANGVWVIANVAAGTYELVGSSGSGAYTSGGTASRVAVRYAMADDIPAFAMYSFRTPATIQQRVAFGCVATQATFNLGQDVADWQASGEAVWVQDSDTFATADLIQRGGLTSFPSEPTGTLPTDGGIIAGFTGRAVIAGSTISNIRQATIEIAPGNVLVKDNFGSYYPEEAEGDERSVTVNFSVHDRDDAGTKALYAAALAKTPISLVLQIGTILGNVYVFQLNGVQLNEPTLDDGQRRFVRSYSGRATGTTPGALDEVRLTVI